MWVILGFYLKTQQTALRKETLLQWKSKVVTWWGKKAFFVVFIVSSSDLWNLEGYYLFYFEAISRENQMRAHRKYSKHEKSTTMLIWGQTSKICASLGFGENENINEWKVAFTVLYFGMQFQVFSKV